MKILHTDETESGPRLRKTLVDLHGITPELVREDIGGIMLRGIGTRPKIDLYSYVKADGERLWFIEAEFWIPPDVQMWRSWVVDEIPDDEQIRDIIQGDE